MKFVKEGRSEWSRRTYAQRGQWQKPLLYLFGRSSKSKVIVLPLYRIPIRAKDRPQASSALPKGKYASRAVSSPEVAREMFHGCLSLSFNDDRARSFRAEVPSLNASSISNNLLFPKPSVFETL